MTRRSKASSTRRGATYVSVASRRLPPAHERVRRFDELGPVAMPSHWLELPPRAAVRSRVIGLFAPPGRPILAKPVSLPRYAALRSLWMRAPARVRFCVQRKQRRETLFALGRAGFSGSAPRPYRRTQESQYSCRR